ncbi:hypothetical protein Tco_1041309 [Tanacetum coccineum]|uniref:Uncharacterized protein n=1 Tax=Tanacetum coccineum TaxID=301880 RepID=A0ABQ5GHH1_9ASTR
MTDAPCTIIQTNQVIEDTHVIINPVNPEGQQQSSSTSSGFVSNMFNLSSDTSINSIFNLNTESTSLVQVKEQVKAQVSKILPKIEETVNEQLEAEVLTRSSNESKTSYAVAANLSELELKKILIDKMENTVSFKRRQDDEDKDKQLSARSNRGSKRRRAGKEPESTSALKEKTSKITSKSTEGSKSHHKSSDKSGQAEEPMHTHPDWFQKLAKPPTLDHDWNKTLPAAHGPVQPWLSTLAQKEDTRKQDLCLGFHGLIATLVNEARGAKDTLGILFWGLSPASPDYVPGPEHLPSLDYVPGPEHPPSPVEVPYVPEPEYPEYLVSSDVEATLEDQPLPIDASPTSLSPGYVADSDPDKDPEEDPKEDHADYPADGGDDDDKPSDDDDDNTDDEDEEPFEDEDDDEEEEEHLAPADSFVVPVVDPVPSAGDTKAFETDESTPTPRSPQIRTPFAQTRLCRAQKTVRLESPMSPSMEARIAEYAAAPAPPSPPPSPLSPWSPLLSQIPLPPPPSSLHLPPPVPTTLPLPSSPLLPLPVSLFIPSPVDRREDFPKAELPPHKRLCLTAPTSRYEVGESSTAAPRPTGDPTEAVEEVVPTTLEGVNARVTDLAAVQEQDTQDDYAMIQDTQDRQTQTHAQMQDYRIASQESLMTTLIAHVSSLQGQLSAALGQIQALQARDQTHADDHEGAGSSA